MATCYANSLIRSLDTTPQSVFPLPAVVPCITAFNMFDRSMCQLFFFFFSSRRRHTRCSRDWSSDVCSSDLPCPDRVRRRAGHEGRLIAGARGTEVEQDPAVRRHGEREDGRQPGPRGLLLDRKSVV